MKENVSNDEDGVGAMVFFIMTLVGKLGLKSLYELRQLAGLEPGGIRSAMKTLENAQLISRSDPGKRRRRDLALTSSGSEFLERSWRGCLRDYADADSVLRSAFVARVMDSPGAEAAYLNQMGELRRERARRTKREEEYLKSSETGPLSNYAWMRISHEAHRRSTEGEVFLAMSGSVKERFGDHASPIATASE